MIRQTLYSPATSFQSPPPDHLFISRGYAQTTIQSLAPYCSLIEQASSKVPRYRDENKDNELNSSTPPFLTPNVLHTTHVFHLRETQSTFEKHINFYGPSAGLTGKVIHSGTACLVRKRFSFDFSMRLTRGCITEEHLKSLCAPRRVQVALRPSVQNVVCGNP